MQRRSAHSREHPADAGRAPGRRGLRTATVLLSLLLVAAAGDAAAGILNARDPAPSPDGSRIAFDTFRGGQTEIVVLDLEGMDVTDLTRRPGNDLVPNWSADGGRIVFGAEVEPGNWDVWIVDTTTLALTRLTSDPAADGGPVFVPEAALPPGGP